MRGQVLNLLMSLQRDLNLTIVFISHDLGIVQQLCNRVAVMYQGKIVEMGDPVHIFQNPKDEYTKQLVTSIPKVPSA
jgi:ABC-type oligopeptide transport system ATPase subunit